MSFVTAPQRRRFALLLVACLVVAFGGLFGGLVGVTSATAGSPTLPTQMTITSISSSVPVPDGVLDISKPNTLVAVGGTVDITVHLNEPSGFPNDTPLKITSTGGTPSPSTTTAPAGTADFSIPVTFTTAANNVGVTLTVTRGPAKGLTSDPLSDSLRFDVLTQLLKASSGTVSFGIGGDDGQCTNATRTNPVCGVVLLPSGAESDILLSTGLCDAAYQCNSHGALIQTLFAGGTLYDRAHPATLVIKCDKSLCGGGQIQTVPVNFSFAGNGALGTKAGACPAKDTVGDGLNGPLQDACVDYVQSKRDGAGDTILYLLFAHDMRGSVG